MNRKIAIAVGGAIVILAAIGAAYYALQPQAADRQNSTAGPLALTATFYPLGYLAQEVGGDFVTVKTIIRPGVEPHDFEPTPQDVIAFTQARVALLNGAGVDSWAERLRNEVAKQGGTVFVGTDQVELLAATDEDGHDGGGYDPHIWLDPLAMIAQARALRNILAEVDSAHAAAYRTQAEELAQRLEQLNANYSTRLANCNQRDIVTAHDAFGYMAKRYNFTVRGISGLVPEGEPSGKQLAELTDFIREHNIRYVLTETLVSPKLTQTLASETGAQVRVLNPLEGLTPEQEATGANYESIMHENLETLALAMDCSN